MRLVIVTGMSGAGKSTALKILEDVGYFCIDNLPVPLMPKLYELLELPETTMRKVALGIDIRSGETLDLLEETLEEFKKKKLPYEILFLDAEEEILVKRYKETRRNHPLSGEGRIDKGIAKEKGKIRFLKERADYILDTSHLLTRELRRELQKIFVENKEYKNLYVTILSFGFKYGIPTDADLVFDVRFLPNPYYEEQLRPKTGNDREVRAYVMQNGTAEEFLVKLQDMMAFLIPNYISEGKHHLVIAVGCTGGRHRSVTMANELYRILSAKEEYGVKVEHRDMEKDTAVKG
ncbi:MAG TPA: RNase adapter RapZ [Lachnospiraceae bacterium]|nr:RNase adapter RapZ [Lachnospiraceae bacterium]